MALKRYNTQELIELCENLFYDYMLEGDTFYAPKEISSATNSRVYSEAINCSNSNPCCMLHSQYLRFLELNKNKIIDLNKTMAVKNVDKSYKQMILSQIEFLSNERKTLEELNKDKQKVIYANSQDLRKKQKTYVSFWTKESFLQKLWKKLKVSSKAFIVTF